MDDGNPVVPPVKRKPGRPRKPVPVLPEIDGPTPLEFLLEVMHDLNAPLQERVRAAITAAQYVHTRTKDGGKKEAAAEAAKKAGSGKFASAPPPKLVINNG